MEAARREDHRIHNFYEGLRIIRIKTNFTLERVCTELGVNKDTVTGWEDGVFTPPPVYLKKLYAIMPDLRYFTDLLPRILKEQLTSRAYAASNESKTLWVPPSPSPADFPVPQELNAFTFGEGLRMAMLDANVSDGDLRDLLDIDDTETVRQWKDNTVLPDRTHYASLLEYLPRVDRAPRPGEVYLIAPSIEGPGNVTAIKEPPIQPDVVSETVKTMTQAMVLVTPRISTPVPVPTKPQVRKYRSKVDVVGAEYANALLSVQHLKRYIEDLKVRIKLAEEELPDLEKNRELSHQKLLDAVLEADQDLP